MKKTQSITFWKKQRVLVTGGSGFLGSFVLEKLREKGAGFISAPRHQEFDLLEKSAIEHLLAIAHPTMIIHLAARCGGIAANQASPGEFFYDNAMMGIQLMEQARRNKVQKFIQVGTVCSYPKITPMPFSEKNFWLGYPEETNGPYGMAKKILLVQSQAYREQYGFNAIYLLPANLYGPRDHFDLQTSHVIPALIRKCLEAKNKNRESMEVWGSGKPSREFLYVEDAADAICKAAESYNEGDPINVGNGIEVPIKDLVKDIISLCNYRGAITWNTSKPDGQPRRSLDVSQAKMKFGFEAKTSLHDGLKKTIQWYLSQEPSLANHK